MPDQLPESFAFASGPKVQGRASTADANKTLSFTDANALLANDNLLLATVKEQQDALEDKADAADLADVATSGSYNDLLDAPAIPTQYTDVQAVNANASAISTASTADRNTDNHVNGTTNKVYTATEKTKLAGIAANATANRSDSATDTAISTAIAGLVNGAPGALDTLKEISDQLALDEAGAAAILASLANKVDKVTGKSLLADTEITRLLAVTGTNTGDETGAGIRTKLGITTLLGANTGDQDLSSYATVTALAAEVTNRTNADTALTAAIVAQKDRLPLNSLCLFFGDSITQFSNNSGTNTNAYQNRGIAAVANLLAGNKYFTANLGVGGDTTALMVARLGAALALKPKVVIILAGANDLIGSVTAATMCANLDTIYQAFLGISCRVFALTILPSYSTYALTGPKETIRQTVNTYLKSYAGITALDADTLGLTSASFSDGLHPNAIGAYPIAVPLAALLTANIDPNPMTGIIVPGMGYTLNPLMTGSAGTLSTATGTVATSWLLDSASNSGGATVVGSKTATNNQEQQVITISGTYTGTGRAVDFSQSFTGTQPVAGDLLEGFVDYEILGSLTNIVSVHMQVQVYTTGFASLLVNEFGNASYDGATPIQYPAGRYTDRTATIAIGAGTPAIVVNRVRIVFKDTASALACSGSIKIYRAGVRKVVS